MLVIVDYRTGNLGSIRNILKRIGVDEVEVASDPEVIARAERLILPGVGSFDAGMRNIRELGLEEVLNRKALGDRVPVLGICLGMQLLLESSEEGQERGLGWIKGRNVRFEALRMNGLKVPHMGWNTVRPAEGKRMFRGQPEEFGFYFVHSYHARCRDEADAAGWTAYGYEFACAVERGNIWGTQFHPEKSHKYGMKLLQTFLESR